MKIGVGLPATIPWVKSADILEWGRRADEGPFSSLGIIDRLVYPNYESLITLAAVAGITRRIRLMTTVLIAPLRATAMLAKQAASLDALSGGRLTLGLSVGRREDDFRAIGVPLEARGRRFVQQVAEMKRIWSGQAMNDAVGPIGPVPAQKGGPELLIGGYTPPAIRRAGQLADGYISGGVADPNYAQGLYRIAEQAWKEAGRPGKPRFVGGMYVVVGEQLAGRAAEYLRDYYGAQADRSIQALPVTPQAIGDLIKRFADVGMDELILWPTVPELDQLSRLAEVAQNAG